MSPAEPVPYITEAEYLEGEKYAEVKHEYFDGRVYPMTHDGHPTGMAGASKAHERVAGNFFGLLLSHLRGRGCQVYKSDMKLRVLFRHQHVFYYPDVMVLCDPADDDRLDPADDDRLIKRKPCLVVEVLSASTQGVDRREKLMYYRELPSLRAYIG